MKIPHTPSFPGAISSHLLAEAKELLKVKGPTCGVMLLHRAALEAILSDHGLKDYHLFKKVKEFVSMNALFAAHETHVLDLKRRGDGVAHKGEICAALDGAGEDLVKADHTFLCGLHQALYAHRQAEHRQKQKAELIRRKRQAGSSSGH